MMRPDDDENFSLNDDNDRNYDDIKVIVLRKMTTKILRLLTSLLLSKNIMTNKT